MIANDEEPRAIQWITHRGLIVPEPECVCDDYSYVPTNREFMKIMNRMLIEVQEGQHMAADRITLQQIIDETDRDADLAVIHDVPVNDLQEPVRRRARPKALAGGKVLRARQKTAPAGRSEPGAGATFKVGDAIVYVGGSQAQWLKTGTVCTITRVFVTRRGPARYRVNVGGGRQTTIGAAFFRAK